MTRTDLCNIAIRCGTDKAEHGYTIQYDKYFSSLRDEKISLLEVGIHKGASLSAWSEYFSNSTIYGIDNCSGGHTDQPFFDPTNEQDFERLRQLGFNIFNADQSNRDSLKMATLGTKYNIIIDDGSHFQADQQISLGVLFPLIESGGFYVIEDVFALTKAAFAHRQKWEPTKNWGIADPDDMSDATLDVFEKFEKTGKLASPYMTADEIEFVCDNIKSIAIYYPGPHSVKGSMFSDMGGRAVLSGASALIIIEKK